MKSEIAKANIKAVEVINNRLQENHKPYVFLEAVYFEKDESFTVFVGYDNWPNSEFCLSYEPIFKTKDDLYFTDLLLHSFTRAALSINKKRMKEEQKDMQHDQDKTRTSPPYGLLNKNYKGEQDEHSIRF